MTVSELRQLAAEAQAYGPEVVDAIKISPADLSALLACVEALKRIAAELGHEDPHMIARDTLAALDGERS